MQVVNQDKHGSPLSRASEHRKGRGADQIPVARHAGRSPAECGRERIGLCCREVAQPVPERRDQLEQRGVPKRCLGLHAPRPQARESGGHRLGGPEQGRLAYTRLALDHQGSGDARTRRVEQRGEAGELVGPADDLARDVRGIPDASACGSGRL